MNARVAYFVNEYPKVSHTFIRREILALERLGTPVLRISLRGDVSSLVDETDQQEFARTRILMKAGGRELLRAACVALFTNPIKVVAATFRAIRYGLRSGRGVLTHLAYALEAAVLKTWLREAGIRHVHAHFGTNPAMVVLLCRLMGGPTYSLTIHGSEEFDRPEALLLREKVQHATFVATVSSFGRSQVMRWADAADWSRIKVVRCALDPWYFDAADRCRKSRPTFLCVGRLSKEKGQGFLVQAAAELRRRGIEADFVLAGDGPLRAEIERQIADLGLKGQVTITGWVDNRRVRELLSSAHALVVPSLAEGLPIVIMEAFAMHVPVISSNLAGIPELVQHGHSGWLVAPSDTAGMADALQESLGLSNAALDAMGAVGHARARANHDADTEAAKLKREFDAILGGSEPRL